MSLLIDKQIKFPFFRLPKGGAQKGKKVLFCFFLHNISLLADGIFLYYVALLLLQGKHGGLLCSFILGLDACLEILLGPFLARFIDTITNLKERLKKALYLQIALALLAFLCGLFNPQKPLGLIFPLLVIRLIALIDQQLRSQLPLHFERMGAIPLVQSLAFALFSQRFILLISSSWAFLLLNLSWFISCSLNSLTYSLAILSLILILKLIADENNQVPPSSLEPLTNPSAPSFNPVIKKWMWCNNVYLFFAGIAFGSAALILTKCMLLAKEQHFTYPLLHGPIPIYSGLFLSLLLMLLYPSQINRLTQKAKYIWTMTASLGLGLAIATLLPFYLRFSLFFLLGILNGIALVGRDAFFQRKIEGADFVKGMAKGQAFGKAGILISLATIGFCIDLNIHPLVLLAICGIAGFIFAFVLFFQIRKLEMDYSRLYANSL